MDADDPVRLGVFWTAALDLSWQPKNDGSGLITGPTPQHTIWINDVPELKSVKHRVHLDIYARQLADLTALGATVMEHQPHWTVMADPEGGSARSCGTTCPRAGYADWSSIVPTRKRRLGGGRTSTGSASPTTRTGSRSLACRACRASPWTSLRSPIPLPEVSRGVRRDHPVPDVPGLARLLGLDHSVRRLSRAVHCPAMTVLAA
jgi:hypothetical protein